MRRTNWRGVWILTLAMVMVLAACSSNSKGGQESKTASTTPSGGEQKLHKVRYAAFNGVSGLAVNFGAEKGFFKEEGLDVEFVTTQNPIESLTSKDVDIADVATTTAIIAAGKGAPIKIVSSMFRTKGPFYLVAAPGINSVEELKGKKSAQVLLAAVWTCIRKSFLRSTD